jgi:hypothetical protein
MAEWDCDLNGHKYSDEGICFYCSEYSSHSGNMMTLESCSTAFVTGLASKQVEQDLEKDLEVLDLPLDIKGSVSEMIRSHSNIPKKKTHRKTLLFIYIYISYVILRIDDFIPEVWIERLTLDKACVKNACDVISGMTEMEGVNHTIPLTVIRPRNYVARVMNAVRKYTTEDIDSKVTHLLDFLDRILEEDDFLLEENPQILVICVCRLFFYNVKGLAKLHQDFEGVTPVQINKLKKYLKSNSVVIEFNSLKVQTRRRRVEVRPLAPGLGEVKFISKSIGYAVLCTGQQLPIH